MNSSLPIAAYKEQILSQLQSRRVIVLVAETGAGKSTQVPQFLLEAGQKLIVTQPRRVAARTVSERVASEAGSSVGDLVGYKIGGKSEESNYSHRTRCLFMTEGLLLAQECGHSWNKNVTWILDEVHERHKEIDILLALAKKKLANDPSFKLVVMSASLDSDRLSAYFDDAPIIKVPGRQFPVVSQEPTRGQIWNAMLADIEMLAYEGRNVLVFLPGKSEITEFQDELQNSEVDAEIIPLHGDLGRDDQNRAFQKYNRPKVILATNVAQTSITIDDIDAVVDSGLERRIEVFYGVERLALRLISKADSKQRIGRAGRCQKGVHIDHSVNAQALPSVGLDQKEFPEPEIRRCLLDQLVLRLAAIGIDLGELELFDLIPFKNIEEAKKVLRALGCLSADNKITNFGRKAIHFACDVRSARMLIEAEKRNCIPEIAAMAAILEVGGIVDDCMYPSGFFPRGKPTPLGEEPIWRKFAEDKESDHVSQLRFFQRVQRAKKEERPKTISQLGLRSKNVREAWLLCGDLLDDAKKHLQCQPTKAPASRDDLLACVMAGMADRLYSVSSGYTGRMIGSSSVVKGMPHWIVAEPFDIVAKRSGRVIPLLQFVSKVDPLLFVSIYPERVEERRAAELSYNVNSDAVFATIRVHFDGHLIGERTEKVLGKEASSVLVNMLTDYVSVNDDFSLEQIQPKELSDILLLWALKKEAARELNLRAGSDRFAAHRDRIRELMEVCVGSASSLAEVSIPTIQKAIQFNYPSQEERRLILDTNPNFLHIGTEALPVSYHSPHPSVDINSMDWSKVPEGTPVLPSGRIVFACYWLNFEQKMTSDWKQAKSDLANKAKRIIFNNWMSRPEVSSDGIETCTFFQGMEAFGVRDPYGATVWTLEQSEAQTTLERRIKNSLLNEVQQLQSQFPPNNSFRNEELFGLSADVLRNMKQKMLLALPEFSASNKEIQSPSEITKEIEVESKPEQPASLTDLLGRFKTKKLQKEKRLLA